MNTSSQALFPVAIDPDALRDYPTDKDRIVHREVIRTLERCGILHVAEADSAELFEAIKGLGDLSKTLWRKLLYALNDLNRFEQPDGPTVRELLNQWTQGTGAYGDVRLMVAGREAAGECGIDDVTGFRSGGGIDIATADSIDRAPSVIEAERADFAPGTPRTSIAEFIVHPLAARSRSVTVFDPHLFDHILGTATPRRVRIGAEWVEQPSDHVEWLVAELGAALPADATINLIGDYPTDRRKDGSLLTKERARADIVAAIGASLASRGQPINVNFCLVQAPKRDTKVSNRYLTFDCGFAFLVDHDFYRLGASDVEGPEDLLLSRLGQEAQQRVRDLAAGYANYTPESARLDGRVRGGS